MADEQIMSIAWEHLDSNYQPLEDDDSEDFEEEGELDEGLDQLIKISNLVRPAHYTPWGTFDPRDPFSPRNLYDLHIGHLKGFNVFTNPAFTSIMDSIDGLAIWSEIDPYRIIVAPAKRYDWSYVRGNIEKALIGRAILTEAEINLEKLKKFTNNFGTQRHIAVLFPNGEIHSTSEQDSNYESIRQELLDAHKVVKDSLCIENGEIVDDRS